MISIASEEILTLSQAAKRLPRRRRGQQPHVATLYRWAQRGLNGAVLETLQVGGTLCTSSEALQRFFERLTKPDSTSLTPSMQCRDRQKAIEQAERELQEAGI